MKNAIFAAVACAATSVFAITPQEATAERFPDADAVMLDDVEDTTYKADGTYESVNTCRVKILTEKGRREEGVITMGYSKRYGTAAIEDVRVIGIDGKERVVDVSATTNESTDNSSSSENIYDPMQRKIVCTVPGLKVGETVCYRTRRTTAKPRVEGFFGDTCVMEWTMPIISQTYRVHAPAGLPLKKTDVRNALGNVKYSKKTAADGSTVHEWKAENTAQTFPEPDTPPMYTQVQRVLVSTAESWAEISKWYWNLCQKHLEKTTPAITNMVASIDPGPQAGVAARTAAIFKWVSQEIRYMGLTMEDTSPGYAPHDVDVTFDNRYGVCRDKAALLAAMLRIAGLEAYPVLIHAGAKMDEGVPLPFFNHAIVAVRAPGDKAANKDGFILMDPTNESSADLCPAYLGDRSYLVAAPWGEPLHVSGVPPAEANAFRAKSKGTLERDGSLVMETTIELTGINDNAYRQALLRRKSEEKRRIAENIAKGVAPGAELISFEIEPRDLRDTSKLVTIRLLYRIDGAVLKGETRDELSLPFFSRSQGIVNWTLGGNTALEKRRYPLVIDSTGLSEDAIEIDLGAWAAAAPSLPVPVAIDGAYSYSRDYAVENGKLFARRRVAVNKVEISPEEYKKMRESMAAAETADRPRPTFAKNPAADAPVRILRSAKTYNVASPYSWTVTNTVRKQVLNYDGKKKSAELKFDYNPTWKSVELVSAVVSNLDGKVSRVAEHEKTLLDCGWAAAAPCYPASKELVVSLPSVEIGSVIEYTVATTVTNAPAPLYAVWMFDSTEPADEIYINYRDWRGEVFSRTVKNARKIESEQMQAPGVLWRDVKIASLGDFAEAARRLEKAADVEPLAEEAMPVEIAKGALAEEKIKTIRDWMAKNVRGAGPSLYEVPLEKQLSKPEDVVKRRYGTRLDYIRTMCAMMKRAGLDASVVFASDDALTLPEIVRLELEEHPCVTRYSAALCRVRERRGGFLWWGGETKEWFVGRENEYTPVGESPYAGSRYLDPETGDIQSRVAAPAPHDGETEITLAVMPTGDVAAKFVSKHYGVGVGMFRKGYAEMLPEDRSRHYMQLLNGLSQGARPASPLKTDIEGYPAELSFAAAIPGYATIADGTASIVLPGVGGRLFPLSGATRANPIGIPGGDSGDATTVVTIFPEGYTQIEHMPSDVVLRAPGTGEVWYELHYTSKTLPDGRLAVVAREHTAARRPVVLGPEYFALLKDWTRIASSREKRTVSVRKGKGK